MGTRSKYAMVSVTDAQSTIEAALSPLPEELVPLSSALGRVLRADVHAEADMPAFAASLKDGYAVVVAGGGPNVPLRLRVDLASHAAPAGAAVLPLHPGEAAYIATGAPLPAGADAVAMVEDATVAGSGADATVTISRWPTPGTDVRASGADAQAGDVLVRSGIVLRAADIGLLAGAGVTKVPVTRRVRVGVLSSGDEVAAGDTPGPLARGAVRDANRPMLLALLTEHLSGAAEALDLGVVSDDARAVRDAVRRAREEVDVLLTSGGVSMGARDFIKPVLEETANVRFGRVNMKPGKPLTFAADGDNWAAVALPGNPVSAFVCFHVAAAIAVRKLAGFPTHLLKLKEVEAVLLHPFPLDKIRPEFHRATLEVRSQLPRELWRVSDSPLICFVRFSGAWMVWDIERLRRGNRRVLDCFRHMPQMRCWHCRLVTRLCLQVRVFVPFCFDSWCCRLVFMLNLISLN